MPRKRERPEVGWVLSEARSERGLTQRQLEVMTGIPKERISKYEHDHVVPSLSILLSLASALNIDVTMEANGDMSYYLRTRKRG